MKTLIKEELQKAENNRTASVPTFSQRAFSSLLKGRIQRIPEAEGLYDNPSEVDAYTDKTKGGIVALIERLFIRRILAVFGHLAGLRVLDVGTGPGWIPTGLAAARPGWQITGVDLSALMLEKAERNAAAKGVRLQWIQAKADDIPLPSGCFDLITSHFCFSEFPDGVKAQEEMHRLLKPGGCLVIQDLERPAQWKLPFLMLWMSLANPFSKLNHQYFESLRGAYTAGELKEIFNGSGFQFVIRKSMRMAGGHLQVWAQKTGILPSGRTVFSDPTHKNRLTRSALKEGKKMRSVTHRFLGIVRSVFQPFKKEASFYSFLMNCLKDQ